MIFDYKKYLERNRGKSMIIPERLKIGDTIGVVAPSDIIEEKDWQDVNNSIQLMEKSGFKVLLSKNVASKTLKYGATPQEKAEDIHNMFKNVEIKAVFAVKGGCNSNSIFDYLDYKLIKQNPKILCGFSDTTSITNVITEKTGLITFNGPTFKSLTSWETDYGYKEVIKRFVDCSLELGTSEEEYITIKDGLAEGKLIGGNLSLISQLVCGKHQVDFTNKILFIEELGWESEPVRVSNYLYYMKQNGVFDKIKGIWLGNYTHESGITLEEILLDIIGDEFKGPIIKSENFGHIDKKTVIPIGIKAKIDTNEKVKIKLLENCVK